MTSYNGLPHIPEQIQSYFVQTEMPDEIVIVDDGSTDGSWEVIQDYQSRYSDTIRAFRNDSNRGVTKNFEKALREADGELIFLSDQDDVWKKNKIAEQLNYYKNNKGNLICHDVDIMDSNATLWERLYHGHAPWTGLNSTECIKELTLRNFVQGASMLIDSELKKQILPIPEGWMYDHFIAYVAAATKGIVDLPNRLSKYRQHGNQERGAAAGLIAKFSEEMKRSFTEYQGYVNWWRALRTRLMKLDPSEIIVDRDWLLKLLNRRVDFNQNRVAIHDPMNGISKRVAAYGQSLARGGYIFTGHTELLLLDFIAVLLGQSLISQNI